MTTAVGVYHADIGKPVRFGGVTINAGTELEGFSNGWNVLYIPQRKLFDGNIGMAVTSPLATSMSGEYRSPLARWVGVR